MNRVLQNTFGSSGVSPSMSILLILSNFPSVRIHFLSASAEDEPTQNSEKPEKTNSFFS